MTIMDEVHGSKAGLMVQQNRGNTNQPSFIEMMKLEISFSTIKKIYENTFLKWLKLTKSKFNIITTKKEEPRALKVDPYMLPSPS
ncbi:hypothetical protein BpHYR1_005947 [Brachionus plicatilis]|uniref:Uncharacterized protein n=1 Tax=Brachionus plicatilis TaxID=10195 RepID=A0A3M7SQU7_BRAPC|nr:hypothetical protein BpHYR1_005947 [Brachionus plicatilis]